MKKFLVLGAVLLMAAVSQNSYALINSGFETGDLSGWTSSGVASVVTSHISGQGTTYSPQDGSYFALLQTGAGQGVYTTLSQNFSILQNWGIDGWAAFDAGDYLPYNDNAWVKILNASGAELATPWSDSVSNVGNYGDGAWTYWNWIAPADGTYTVKYGVANVGDNILDSYAMFDSKAAGIVPEPATMSLLGLSLLGLFGIRRKKI